MDAPMNEFLVSIDGKGRGIVILRPPPPLPISAERALALAAWIVAVSGVSRDNFEAILSAVENS